MTDLAQGGATRVQAHVLRSGGAPYLMSEEGEVKLYLPNLANGRPSTAGVGMALCRCGWTSEIYSLRSKRKQAWRDHYDEMAGIVVAKPVVEEVEPVLPPGSVLKIRKDLRPLFIAARRVQSEIVTDTEGKVEPMYATKSEREMYKLLSAEMIQYLVKRAS